MRKRIVPIAQLFLAETPGEAWVKEATNHNDGPLVESLLCLVGGVKGWPWCAAFVCWVLELAYRGRSPLPRTASCDVFLAIARKKGWLQADPIPGDVFLVMKTKTDAVHTGIVTAVSPLAVKTIEGNTNAGGSREGWGVFPRERARKGLAFIRLPDVIPTETARPIASVTAP